MTRKKEVRVSKANPIVLAWINPKNPKDRGRQKFITKSGAETAAKHLESQGYDIAYVNTKYNAAAQGKAYKGGRAIVGTGKALFKALNKL